MPPFSGSPKTDALYAVFEEAVSLAFSAATVIVDKAKVLTPKIIASLFIFFPNVRIL